MGLHCRECALKDGIFIRNYRSDPAIYSILPAPKEQPCTQFSIKKSFKPFFSTNYFTWEKCVQCAFAFQRMRVERRVFYPKISQRSCYIQHCTCTQKVAMHSMFNIKEFHCGFSTLYYTISKCILHGNSACSMRFQCTKCASKEGYFIRRYRSDPAMYSTIPPPKKQPCAQCSIKKGFKLVFLRFLYALSKCILH